VYLHGLKVFLFGVMLFSGLARATEVTVQSGPARTYLLELFTSEGCSSCPPAENWLSTLRASPRLWKEVVPVAFHINYWDDLGWKDSLATPAFTNRQRDYAAAWGAPNIYTPEFVLNGREWRDRDLDSIPLANTETGMLSATLRENGDVQITFHPLLKTAAKWQAHAALLGFGVSSDVKAGENGGRRLVHDFVVLDLQGAEMNGEVPNVLLHLPQEKIKSGRTAFAVWITVADKLEPLQAAGGDL
jgi:hypothetical protein